MHSKTALSHIGRYDPTLIKEEVVKLFEHGIRDMMWVERRLTKALPKLISKTSNAELRTALENHLHETEEHVTKLEEAMHILDMGSRGKKCAGMEGILTEGDELMGEFASAIVDVAIVNAARKVEHYEISAYCSLLSLALQLAQHETVKIFESILAQEKKADKLLEQIETRLDYTGLRLSM